MEGSEAWGTILESLVTTQRPPQLVGPLEKWAPQVVGRCLGSDLLEVPTTIGRDNLAQDINTCHEDLPTLAPLTELYVGGMARLCMFVRSP